MKLDLIQTKIYQQSEVKYTWIGIFGLSLLLGCLPLGYIFAMSYLSYFFTREDEQKYFFIMGMSIGSFMQGVGYGFMVVLMMLMWIVLMQFRSIMKMMSFQSMNVIGLILSGLMGWFSQSDVIYLVMMLMMQYCMTEYLLMDFYKEKKSDIWMILILVCFASSYLLRQYAHQDIAIFLIHMFVLLFMQRLPMRRTLFLMFLLYFAYEQTPYLSYSTIPLLLAIMGKEQHKWNALFLYAFGMLLMYYEQPFLYASFVLSAFMVFLLPFVVQEEATPEVPITSKAIHLLQQFASIFQDIAKLNQNAVLPIIARSLQESANELQVGKSKEDQMKGIIYEVLDAYGFIITRLEMTYQSQVIIRLHIQKMHSSEIETMILPLLTKALRVPLFVLRYSKTHFFDSYHCLELATQKGLHMQYDMRQQRLDAQACGDSVLAMVHHGDMIYALSDGMGSGIPAKEQSSLVLSSLEKLVEANVPLQTAIKLVNQLALIQKEERFATLDVLSIDRFHRQGLLYKSGTAQTYLLRNNTVYAFLSESLPIGIIERINPDFYVISIQDDDIFCIVSDGGDHACMKEWIKESYHKNCSRMLQQLYDKRRSQSVDDDLTMVLVAVKESFLCT